MHGAIIQGGRGGSSRQRRPPQQSRQGGGIDDGMGGGGGSGSGSRLERKADRRAHEHAKRAATARSLPYQTTSAEEYHVVNAASPVWPRTREDDCDSRLEQQRQQEQRMHNRHDPSRHIQHDMYWGSPSSRSESAGSGRHRLSPPMGHVSVSWGEEDGDDNTREESTRMRGKLVGDGGETLAERGLGELGLEHKSWNMGEGWAGYPRGGLYGTDGGTWTEVGQSVGGGGSGIGGREYAYTPLSKGPDYRKVRTRRVYDKGMTILGQNSFFTGGIS